MGLYLCVFEGERELDGVDVGGYDDFHCFRSSVTQRLEGGRPGALYPTLILHADSDGEWTALEAGTLERELRGIEAAFRNMPPEPFHSEWQVSMTKLLGLRPASLYECFIDVDGEPLIERLLELCALASVRNLSILFQ